MHEQFWRYIKSKLNAATWGNLPYILNCKPTRVTRLKSGNSDFEIYEIEKLASLINENPVELATRFKLGYRTNSIDTMTQFAASHGQVLNVQIAA